MKKLALILAIITCTPYAHSAIIVKGNDENSPFGFKSTIETRALDYSTGIFYVGLNNGDDIFTLSKISRYSGQSTAQFTGFAPESLQNTSINLLTLSYAPNVAARLVGAHDNASNSVFVLKNDGSSFSESGELNDANGNSANSIIGIAATTSHIVAAVSPNGGSFGDAYSGLALVALNNDLSLSIKNATTGLSGNLALQLDKSSSVFTGNTNDVTINNDQHDIVYDAQLDRFYIGTSMQTNNANGDIAKSITNARINVTANNELTLQEIAPNSVINSGATNQILVAQVDASTIDLTINRLGVLHASTGPTYLIIAGGNGSNNGNSIYAVPLVDNTTNPTEHGTIADKGSVLVNGKFITPATMASEFPLNTDTAAFVGASTLPIETSNTTSDMMVIGDTVYVSINVDSDTNNEPGIFYSHALFDETGKIISWTPWTKKALPFNAFPAKKLPNEALHDGKVFLFQVDLVNGKIWFIEGTTQQVVGITSWESPRNTTNDTPLVEQLNTVFSSGAYAALDLDQSTRGLCDQTVARYALFGGAESVAFVRISQAQSTAINAPQTIPNDFSTEENFKLSSLPKDACCCQVLQYSRRLNSDGNQNYFFAGTKKGLFAFADVSKNGFTIDNNVNALNASPFLNGMWHTIEAIQGSILAIETTGNTLYVLTQTTSPSLKSTVYRIDFTDNLDTMFVNPIIIAQTGTSPFSTVQAFYDISIIAVNSDGSEEQLLLATNAGLYQSTRTNGVQAATDSTDANWLIINNKNKNIFWGIAKTDNTPINSASCPTILPTTAWPFSLSDPSSNKIFNAGKLYQVSGNTTGSLSFNPLFFNSASGITFNNIEPITEFFTDGARRFFIINRQSDPFTSNNIMVLPYDNSEWNIQNQAQTIITDPQLKKINALFWIRHIGTTGSLLIGTDIGVFSLD